MRALATAALLGLATTAGAQERVVAPTGNYVALVVGISSYANLPDEVELDYARSDAAQVAESLRKDADFTHVFLLGDGEATKDGILAALRDQAGPLLGPQDVFVLYFAGHGIGADLGLPTFFAHDSTLANGQEDGLELASFARELKSSTTAGTTLVVTDAIHAQAMEGFTFYGPAAGEWPKLSRNTMVVSATQSRTPGKDGAFGKVFAQAMGGQADTNRDTMVTASELIAYLVAELSPHGQIPVAAGDFAGGMVVARGVTPPEAPAVAVGTATSTGPAKPEMSGPAREIRSAKFIWSEGSGQRITCEGQQPESCEPSCYARRFQAGACKLDAVVDGVPMAGWVVVTAEGRYDCKSKGPELACDGPKR
ncbi:MAG: caspase family protein [Deltaproteobacteria bacterium]|nr:MAG: caspase family protein [Deltaproteobacteria bacterium]